MTKKQPTAPWPGRSHARSDSDVASDRCSRDSRRAHDDDARTAQPCAGITGNALLLPMYTVESLLTSRGPDRTVAVAVVDGRADVTVCAEALASTNAGSEGDASGGRVW